MATETMKTTEKTYNYDKNKDRISDLPDEVLLYIISSFLNTKEAVQTCILSTRWKHLWKHLFTFKLSSKHFNDLTCFINFLSYFLSLRNTSIEFHAVDFYSYSYRRITESQLLKFLEEFVSSHTYVQQLQLNIATRYNIIEYFPPCFFSSHTLTSLNLTFNGYSDQPSTIFPNSLNLPALTSLYLRFFAFRGDDGDCSVEPFSTFKSLNTLIILSCELLATNLNISNDTLVNLTMEWFNYPIHLCTPSLCNFDFRCVPYQKLCMSKSDLSSIKHVDIDIRTFNIPANTSLILLNWLRFELANIESLSVTLYILKLLSQVPDLMKVDFPSLRNLKSLKIRTYHPSSIPYGIVDFLLQNVPSLEPDIILLSPRNEDEYTFYEDKDTSDEDELFEDDNDDE